MAGTPSSVAFRLQLKAAAAGLGPLLAAAFPMTYLSVAEVIYNNEVIENLSNSASEVLQWGLILEVGKHSRGLT